MTQVTIQSNAMATRFQRDLEVASGGTWRTHNTAQGFGLSKLHFKWYKNPIKFIQQMITDIRVNKFINDWERWMNSYVSPNQAMCGQSSGPLSTRELNPEEFGRYFGIHPNNLVNVPNSKIHLE